MEKRSYIDPAWTPDPRPKNEQEDKRAVAKEDDLDGLDQGLARRAAEKMEQHLRD